MTTDLRTRFGSALGALGPGPSNLILAVSGGPDSVALLDLAAAVAPALRYTPIVAHFDHGIHPDSALVAAQVVAAATRYGLRCRTGRVELGPGASETAARRARLAWLESVAEEEMAGSIATGHHRDDQVETMVMRFLKGSGPSGLAGISRRRGRWIRPLLDISRAEIVSYLAEQGLASFEDPGNIDQRHLRNWVRSDLLPRIERRLPNVRQNLGEAAGVFAENRQAWAELLDQLPALELRGEADGVSVAADPLREYSSAVVRSLLKALGFRVGVGLGKRRIDRLQRLVLEGHSGQTLDLSGTGRAELAFGRLRLYRGLADFPDYRLSVDAGVGHAEVANWQLRTSRNQPPEPVPRGGFATWVPADASLVVRPWRPGDRIRPIRGRGSRLVVRCMQDSKVPRSHRPKWPVFEYQGEVIWVPGVCRSDGLLPEPATLAMRIDVSPR